MSRVFVHGVGAVSPAGWGMTPFREALERNLPVSTAELKRPGWKRPLHVRQVPAPVPRPPFLAHARLRRTSPITQYAVAAALEALGKTDLGQVPTGEKLGVVLCVMSGCVNYSRRFYDETLKDPATASPLVFPETVFNAPSSHLAALIGTTAINYTLVGDPGTFLQGIALGADWLVSNELDGCLVVGAEEIDWLTADAFRLFTRQIVLGDGAGALYLRKEPPEHSGVELTAVTEPHLFTSQLSRFRAAVEVRQELREQTSTELLCDSAQNIHRLDAPESLAWTDFSGTRLSPKTILGEGLMAAAAWQCVAAVDAIQRDRVSSAEVSVVGCNQQAIGAHFSRAVAAALAT